MVYSKVPLSLFSFAVNLAYSQSWTNTNGLHSIVLVLVFFNRFSQHNEENMMYASKVILTLYIVGISKFHFECRTILHLVMCLEMAKNLPVCIWRNLKPSKSFTWMKQENHWHSWQSGHHMECVEMGNKSLLPSRECCFKNTVASGKTDFSSSCAPGFCWPSYWLCQLDCNLNQ